MAYPLVSTLSGVVKYNDGTTLFDGWVLLLLAYPIGYTQATVGNQLWPQPIGDHIQVRIQNGVYDQTVRIYQNQSIQPPQTQYAAYYYDNEGVNLGHTGLFVINSSPYTITYPSMSVPVATAITPTP